MLVCLLVCLPACSPASLPCPLPSLSLRCCRHHWLLSCCSCDLAGFYLVVSRLRKTSQPCAAAVGGSGVDICVCSCWRSIGFPRSGPNRPLQRHVLKPLPGGARCSGRGLGSGRRKPRLPAACCHRESHACQIKEKIIQTIQIFSRFDSFFLFQTFFCVTPWNSNPHWKWTKEESFPAFEADVVAYLLFAVGCCRCSAKLKMLLPALQVVCPSPEGDGKLTDYVLPDGAHNTYVNVKNTFKHNSVNQQPHTRTEAN